MLHSASMSKDVSTPNEFWSDNRNNFNTQWGIIFCTKMAMNILVCNVHLLLVKMLLCTKYTLIYKTHLSTEHTTSSWTKAWRNHQNNNVYPTRPYPTFFTPYDAPSNHLDTALAMRWTNMGNVESHLRTSCALFSAKLHLISIWCPLK